MNLATVNGDITMELTPTVVAEFSGNVIEGKIDSDFPLSDNAPNLPNGERPAKKVPRIVQGVFGSGGPRLSATVVKGNIRLLRRSTE
jgi:hypothetical protein